MEDNLTGWIRGWMDSQMRWIDDGWVHGWGDHIGGCIGRQMGGQRDRWVGGWVDGYFTDRWEDGWMDGQTPFLGASGAMWQPHSESLEKSTQREGETHSSCLCPFSASLTFHMRQTQWTRLPLATLTRSL